MARARLKISNELSLPLDFVTSTQAILAKKGKGKSYTASVQAEELLAAHQQVVVVDPTGAWWGLRSSADGKSSGFAIAVLGGEHGDVPLEATAGEVIGDAIATEHFSAVLDLSLFRKAEANRFMGVLLETLYRRNREALHLFIDEADTVAPQKPFGDEARTLGATEDIVRRGRIRGIGCTLITQRPQVLNKNVLSQVDMLTTLGMNHPKDIAAIKEWVAVHGDEDQAKRMIAELPALPIGQAWVWAPAADIFERVTIRRRTTFDSGKTPKAGERALAPKVLADVDIARLGATIAATVEKAKANDPKALRARVAELEKLLHRKLSAKERARVETKTIEKPVIKAADIKRIETVLGRLDNIAGRMFAVAESFVSITGSMRAHLTRWAGRSPAEVSERAIAAGQHFASDGKVTVLAGKHQIRVPATEKTLVRADGRQLHITATARGDKLPTGEAAVLRALIMYPNGLMRDQLGVLTGYKRSSRDSYIARLKERGFVTTDGQRCQVTARGGAAMPDAEPLPTGAALRTWWLERLPTGERAILEHLIASYPDPMARSTLDEQTEYKRSSRDSYISRLAARELVQVLSHGSVRASETLFEAA